MRWASISIYPFSFEGEQVLLSEIIDITDRKQAEEALKASEERFHTIYENVTIGLYRTTPDGRILMLIRHRGPDVRYDLLTKLPDGTLKRPGLKPMTREKNFVKNLSVKDPLLVMKAAGKRRTARPFLYARVQKSSAMKMGRSCITMAVLKISPSASRRKRRCIRAKPICPSSLIPILRGWCLLNAKIARL